MAHVLKLNVVAEGVETEAQLEFLKSQQCDYFQGYLISRPQSVEDMTRLLNNNTSESQSGKNPHQLPGHKSGGPSGTLS